MNLRHLLMIVILFTGLFVSGCQKDGPEPEYEKAPEPVFENCC